MIALFMYASYLPGHRYWGLDGGPVVSVWLALDDSQEENGALQVIPGKSVLPRHNIHLRPF